jgi:hypothetical protein
MLRPNVRFQRSKRTALDIRGTGEETGERETKYLQIGMVMPVSKTVSGR